MSRAHIAGAAAALALGLPGLALAQPRAAVLSGDFWGVIETRGSSAALTFSEALSAAERHDVLDVTGADDPAVYQSAQTIQRIEFDPASTAGAKIAEVCAAKCHITGTIAWREPNDWWFTGVTFAERLSSAYDFGVLSSNIAGRKVVTSPVADLAPADALYRPLLESLRAEMEVQIGQPLRFDPLAVRRQGDFAYVVVQPWRRGETGDEEVDFKATRWREQWRYGPWDGGIIHALFHQDGERWSLETFVISPVTAAIVPTWAGLYRAPSALFAVNVRSEYQPRAGS